MLSGAQWSHRATMGPLRTGVMRGGRGTRTLAHLTHHFSQDGSSAEHDNVTWGVALQPGSVPGQVGDFAASPTWPGTEPGCRAIPQVAFLCLSALPPCEKWWVR